MTNLKIQGVPFFVRPEDEYEHFRLFELPADLLQIIQQDQSQVLRLKPRNYPSSDGEYVVGDAVLCTNDRSFAVHQISHSNTVYLTRGHKHVSTSSSDTKLGLATCALVEESYELHPIQNESAIVDLKSALPVYTTNGVYDGRDLKTKLQHLDQVPTSQIAFERAWKQLACFELDQPQGSFRPSAAVRVQTWTTMLNHALAEGVDITGSLTMDQVQGLLTSVEDVPMQVANSVWIASTNDEGVLDRDRCLNFVGSSLLEETCRTTGSIPLALFLQRWADAVPEKWRKEIKISLLGDVCSVIKSDITFVDADAQDGPVVV